MNTYANWFVGLPVADAGWFRPLVAGAPRGLRVFNPDDLHLTVAFLGQCDFRYADEVKQLIDTIDFAPFSISFNHLTPFPPERKPTVVSFTLDEGDDAACDVIRRWREPLLSSGHARPDTRLPLPHVTVARIRRDAGIDDIQNIENWAKGVQIPEIHISIDRVALYTWADDRRERQFKIVHEKRVNPDRINSPP